MGFFDRLFAREQPNRAMAPLYDAIVAEARRPHWYTDGRVPDTIDGRFDMVCMVLSLVMVRLEEESTAGQEIAWLTELFISDMEGQLRQIGIGDMVVGKHVGRLMGALGGRLGAYRDMVGGAKEPRAAFVPNLYRGEEPSEDALAHVEDAARALHERLERTDAAAILAGDIG